MEIHRPLFWHQGLFLQPQHFQTLDLSFSTQLTPYQEFMQPHFWGVRELEIKKAALGVGSLSILKGTFLFPDGTYVVFPGNAVIEDRSFEEAWLEDGRPLYAYLGLRKLSMHGGNVTVVKKGEPLSDVNTRFVTNGEAEEIKDLHAGGQPGHVKRLNYFVRIFWESEQDQLGDYLLIPIARIERMGNESVLSSHFAPPCISLSVSDSIGSLLKDLMGQISARCRQLEEHKIQRGIHTAEFGSRDMVYLLALRSLNRYIPLLQHYSEARNIHPWIIYGALRQLIGELSSFSGSVNVHGETEEGQSLPAYDHLNLWQCFSVAQSLVARLLDEITAGPDYVVKLDFDGTYFAAELRPAMFEGRNRFYLAVRTNEEPKKVIETVSSIAKFGEKEQMPVLISHALTGITLAHLPLPPQELPRRANVQYFAVDTNCEHWVYVKKSYNLNLYWDNPPEDVTVELMVVTR